MTNFKPKDLIACLTLTGIFVLKLRGMDGQVDIVGALILGYYFSHRQNGIDKGI